MSNCYFYFALDISLELEILKKRREMSQQTRSTMSYRKDIITAITALKNSSRSGPTSITIKKQVQANLPTDKKWNIKAFIIDFNKLTQHGHLVRSKGGCIKFSADFEEKLLQKEAAAAKLERLNVEAVATRQKSNQSKNLKRQEEKAAMGGNAS